MLCFQLNLMHLFCYYQGYSRFH